MKNYSSIFFSLILFMMALRAVSQELPEVVPPSPEAASLGKFTEVPISHYTGLPNISVPITSFSVGGKSFPVSLSYHARGIKTEETASRVGLGWALNAGGQIIRQIRNKADDGLHGYYTSPTVSDFIYSNNNETLSNILPPPFNGTDYDKIPDQYSLQVGSLSAKFIHDYMDNFKPLVQNYDDIVIEGNFTVTDKDGYVYSFTPTNYDTTEKEYTFSDNLSNYVVNNQPSVYSTQQVYNTWHLTRIESPNGDYANLIYNEEEVYMYRRSFDEENPDPFGTGYFNYTSLIRSRQYQLSEIRYDYSQSGYKKIVFNATDLRQDTNTITWPSAAKELDSIKLYDRHGNPISSFYLFHSYMNSTDTSNYHELLVQLDNSSSKRLVLDSIVEVGKNGAQKPAYKFIYNTRPLPNRFSNSQDFWGYYNGGNNGRFLSFHGAANRRVDTVLSESGMLKKIIYPTGGSTRFTYEHNKGIKGAEYDNTNFPAINPASLRSESLSHISGSTFYNGNAYVKEFVIGQAEGLVNFSIDLPDWTNLFGAPNYGYDQDVECSNPSTNECRFSILLQRLDSSGNVSQTYSLNSGNYQFSLPPGDYRLTLDPMVSNWQLPPYSGQQSAIHSFLVSMTWDEQIINEDVMLYSSGKRIKQIDFLDSGNNVVSKKVYDYNGSGIILSIPYFTSASNGYPNSFAHPPPAIPGSIFNTYQGNTIGYSKVTEYFGDQNNNHGKTVYDFIVHKDGGEFTSFPVTPPTDNEWLRGLPKYINSFKNDNGVYKKVKEIKTDYNYGDFLLALIFMPQSVDYFMNNLPVGSLPNIFYEKTRTNFQLPIMHFYFGYDPNNNTYGNNKIKVYHFTGGTLDTKKTTETLFDENEVPTLITETENEFDYNNHYQLSRVTSVSSDGIPIIKKFTYPQTSTGPLQPFTGATYSSNPITALSQKNIVVPIENQTYRDDNNNGVVGFPNYKDELISHTKTIFAWDDTYSNILEPIKIQTSKGDGNLVDRIEFKDYDAKGNVLQVSKTSGIDICYIYGYNNSLPVAKIENATYSQVQSYVNAIKNASNNDTTSCMLSESCNENSLRAAQNSLRNGLPNAMVTTYTYDPLIGITSMTDPKGYTVYYEYDDANRLERVKDEDGKIMSENKYHYLLDN